MGDISVREYIRWLPDESSEPTLTIVLTSPERRFVDLRILLDPKPSATGDLPLSSLDWAIAGTSSSWIRDDEAGGEPISHSRWNHWINSRTAEVDGVSDEGDMFTQSDGAILETGKMVNLATGRETAYEELWRSETVEVVPSSFPGGFGLSSTPGAGACVVLRLQHDDEDSVPTRRGMVVRLGQYCQSMLRKGAGEDDITVERWKWDSATGAWVRLVRIGRGEVPTDFATLFGDEAMVGDAVKVGEDVWTVVEKS